MRRHHVEKFNRHARTRADKCQSMPPSLVSHIVLCIDDKSLTITSKAKDSWSHNRPSIPHQSIHSPSICHSRTMDHNQVNKLIIYLVVGVVVVVVLVHKHTHTHTSTQTHTHCRPNLDCCSNCNHFHNITTTPPTCLMTEKDLSLCFCIRTHSVSWNHHSNVFLNQYINLIKNDPHLVHPPVYRKRLVNKVCQEVGTPLSQKAAREALFVLFAEIWATTWKALWTNVLFCSLEESQTPWLTERDWVCPEYTLSLDAQPTNTDARDKNPPPHSTVGTAGWEKQRMEDPQFSVFIVQSRHF